MNPIEQIVYPLTTRQPKAPSEYLPTTKKFFKTSISDRDTPSGVNPGRSGREAPGWYFCNLFSHAQTVLP